MAYALFALAVLDGAALVWFCKQWRQQPNNLALLISLGILLPVFLDALFASLGASIGFGTTLELVTRTRLMWFMAITPLLAICCAMILREAGMAVRHEIHPS
jgi:hypothetical protein